MDETPIFASVARDLQVSYDDLMVGSLTAADAEPPAAAAGGPATGEPAPAG